jgi:23S rRNA (adenine-N6)-dimethyltransferase
VPAPRRAHAGRGQHFLRSRTVAQELVEQAGIGQSDLVVEIGAGTGRLTTPLAERARSVWAIESDPDLAARLGRRFAHHTNVLVLHADARTVALPRSDYRAFGNLPFGVTTDLLRRLLDDPALTHLDAIVQYEVARKRAAVWPSTQLSTTWAPWWRSCLVRRLPAAAFAPPPSVDAGVLSVRRQDPPLLPHADRRAFARLVRSGFRGSPRPVRLALRGILGRGEWRRFASDRGLLPDASARELDSYDWIALYRIVRRR